MLCALAVYVMILKEICDIARYILSVIFSAYGISSRFVSSCSTLPRCTTRYDKDIALHWSALGAVEVPMQPVNICVASHD